MKKILLFMLLFVNLQIVTSEGDFFVTAGTEVKAQHHAKKPGDNCYDSEFGWYHSPLSDCREIEVAAKFEDATMRKDQEGGSDSGKGRVSSGGGGGKTSGSSGTSGTSGNRTSDKDRYSVSRAVYYLRANANPCYDEKNCGKCAAAVRNASQAGGIDTSIHPLSAKDYGYYLKKWGFSEIGRQGYVPKMGDVKVYQPYHIGNPNGHINMYDGKDWVSDFIENPKGPGPGYRSANDYVIYRK
jgi:hypothetical protein